LDVVKRRLEEVGLGHLAIVLHGADLSPRKVMQQVAHTLEVVRSAVPVDCQEVHTRLVERRNRLNAHVERMHTLREPTRKSIYEMQGIVLRLACSVDSSTRWRGAELSRLAPPVDREISDLLAEASGFAPLFLRTDPSPWTGAVLADGAAVPRALDLVQRMHSETLPRFLESVKDVVAQTRLRRPESTLETTEVAGLLEAVQTTLALYSTEFYRLDLGSLLRDLAPGRRRGFSAIWAWCSDGRYRRARKSVLAMRIVGKTSSVELYKEVSDAATQSQRWRTWSGGKSMPVPFADAEKHIQNLRRVCEQAAALSGIV